MKSKNGHPHWNHISQYLLMQGRCDVFLHTVQLGWIIIVLLHLVMYVALPGHWFTSVTAMVQQLLETCSCQLTNIFCIVKCMLFCSIYCQTNHLFRLQAFRITMLMWIHIHQQHRQSWVQFFATTNPPLTGKCDFQRQSYLLVVCQHVW